MARRGPRRQRGRLLKWTYSSTRASSTSPGSASRCPPGAPPTPSTRRSIQADKAGYPVVVKAQVQVGGRGKAGGIKLANDAEEVRTHAGNILGMDIKGHVVKRLWVEHAVGHRRGVLRLVHARPLGQEAPADAVGRGRRGDRAGGRGEPRRHREGPHRSGRRAHARRGARGASTAAKLDPEPPSTGPPTSSTKLYRCFVDGDCDLAEINPLIFTPEGKVHALDAKVSLDDNAAVPPSRVGRVPGHGGARRSGATGQGEGSAVHRPRRHASASSPTAPVWP